MSEYTVRWYRPADRSSVLALHETVFGHGHGPDWFAWKFVDPPALDHVPMTVAERDGTLVGARPCLPMRMAVDGRPRVALQPCDTMVHPDHRRNGLFTRMTERLVERYVDGEPRFLFNFPNDRSAAGYLDMGWRRVGQLSTTYRVTDPETILGTETESRVLRTAGQLAKPLVDGCYRLNRSRRSVPDAVSVRQKPGVAAGTLAGLAAANPPDGIHAVRDETFYRWRFATPAREYTTYVASDGSDETAAAVVGRAATQSPATVELTDVLPLREAPVPAIRAVLDRVVTDYPDAGLFVAPTDCLPASVRREFGFIADGATPLTTVGSPTNHVVRPLDGWRPERTALVDSEAWAMSLTEHDTH